jgi:putative membrane protein
MSTKSSAALLAALLALSLPHNRMSDTDFMNTASRSNLAEIAAGKLAEKQAGSRAVRAFADSMVKDHVQAQQELVQVARAERVPLAQDLDTAHTQLIGRLKGLSGVPFDTAYIHAELSDHDAAVQLFQQEFSLGRDSLSRVYATKYLPEVQHHQDMVRQLSKQ